MILKGLAFARLPLVYILVAFSAFLFGVQFQDNAIEDVPPEQILPDGLRPEQVMVGPFTFAGGSISLMALSLVTFFAPAIFKFATNGGRHSDRSPTTVSTAIASAKTETAATTISSVQLNLHNTLTEPRTKNLDPHLKPEIIRAFHYGEEIGFKKVISVHMDNIVANAKGLADHFAHESHPIRYRKSKLSRLSNFCDDLQDQADSRWFDNAIRTFGEVFSRKRDVLSRHLEKLLSLAKEFDELEQQNGTEETYQKLYSRVVERLEELMRELQQLNVECVESIRIRNSYDGLLTYLRSYGSQANFPTDRE